MLFGKKIKLTGRMKSAKQLGEMLGMNAQEVNKLLKKKGFLDGEPGVYTVTSKGEKYSELRQKDNGYGGYAARSWEFVMWDEAILNEISDDRFPGIDWYCDKCNAFLNRQKGFDDHKKVWKCTECGFKNSISEDSINR